MAVCLDGYLARRINAESKYYKTQDNETKGRICSV